MNLRLSVLTLLRSPIKTLITFALLVATSFAFVSRGVEFITTEQVIADAESEYVAVGTLVNTEDKYVEVYNWYSTDFEVMYGENYMDGVRYFCPIDEAALDLLLSTDYIEASEVRHTAGGVTADDIWTAAETPIGGGFSSNGVSGHSLQAAVAVIYCHTTIGNAAEQHAIRNVDPKYGQIEAFFTIEELIAGDPDMWPVGVEPQFYTDEYGQHKYRNHVPSIQTQSWDSIYDELIEGHRYLVILSPHWATNNRSIMIAGVNPFMSYYGGRDVLPYRLLDLTLLEEEKGAPLEYEDYADFLEDRFVQLLMVNHHKEELIYTSDMSLLPRFHDGTLYISEGRALTAEDTESVCVIGAEFAARNGIAVGDTIDFDVDPNSMVYYGESYAREIYSPSETVLGSAYTDYDFEREKMTYEVVGIWSAPPYPKGTELDDPQSGDPDALRYSYNTVFVPEATYPWAEEVEAPVFPSTFSFRLKHPGDMAKLEYELGDKLAEMGYTLMINDLGYSDVEKSFDAMRSGALVGFVAMAAALVLSLVLIVYLFIIRRKGEYAIMRALGVSAKRASGSLLTGLAVLSIAAIAVGCGIAMATAFGYARELAASMASLTGENASLVFAPWPVPVLGLAVLALLMLFASTGLYTIGKKPPLELLQNKK